MRRGHPHEWLVAYADNAKIDVISLLLYYIHSQNAWEKLMEQGYVRTLRGGFFTDADSEWHYQQEEAGGTVDMAAQDAIGHRPAGACWFWFNNTPTPLFPTDTTEQLVQRWWKWREALCADPSHTVLRLVRVGVVHLFFSSTQEKRR
jgi:hypothetical protein